MLTVDETSQKWTVNFKDIEFGTHSKAVGRYFTERCCHGDLNFYEMATFH